MDSQESTPLQHQQPLQGHGTMVATPTQTLPPPQSPQQEQPDKDMLPTNIIFQQQNLPFPFSGQNPKTPGSVADVVVGDAAEPSKKKRGRPRKYSTDGYSGVAGAASKKVRGRTPGSEKKLQQPEALGSVGFESMQRVIHVNIGEDIVSIVRNFLHEGPPAVCVISATGFVRNVTLHHSAMASGTMAHEGQFAIISLSGSLIFSQSNGSRGIRGGISVLLSGPDNNFLGGVVARRLEAASPVEVVVTRPHLSQVSQATHPDVNAASPLSHERGPFGNVAQPMHAVPPTE